MYWGFSAYLFLSTVLLNNSSKALSNEFILKLTHLRRSNLPHHLFTRSLSSLLEFTHIFTVTLTLFLLGVNTACEERGG
jgi:hypothetical protein